MASGGRVPNAASRPTPTTTSFQPNSQEADPRFVVGVVDTGLVLQNDRVHRWLSGHVNDHDGNADIVPESPGVLGVNDGHGTFIAGLILQQAPGASIRMIRALDIGDPDALDKLVTDAVATLLEDTDVKVINLSFGGQTLENNPPAGIRDALEAAGDLGVVVTAPAGNRPSGDKVWPAAFAADFSHVVSVGAVDETPFYLAGGLPPRASFSNCGPWVKAYASGVDVLGPFCDFTDESIGATFNGWARWSGTSFAAATVAGVISRKAMDDNLSAVDAAEVVLRNQLSGPSRKRGWDAAIAYVQGVDSTWSVTTEPSADDAVVR